MKLLLLSLLLIAEPGTQADTGSIEGTVSVLGSVTSLPTAVVRASGSGRNLQTTSDASGHFSFTNLPDGSYFVYADAAGYSRPYKGGYSKSVGVKSGGRINDVRLTLVPAGSLRGRVYRRDGTPVSGAPVVAHPTTYYGNQVLLGVSASLQSYTAQTNAQGEYEMRSVNPAEYYIAAGLPGANWWSERTYSPNAMHPANGKPVVVTTGANVVADVQLQGVSLFKVSGRVIDETPSGGMHRLTGLYLINRDTRVRDDVPPDAISSPSRVSTGIPQPDTNLPTTFLNEGRFEILNVRPGSYDLFAIIVNTFSESATPYTVYVGRTALEVSSNVENATVAVRPGVTVVGNAQFGLMPIGTTPAVPAITNATLMANPDGQRFSMSNVPPGTYGVYTVFVDGPGISDVLQNGKSIYDSGLLVGDSPPDSIEIQFTSSPGAVKGAVQSSDPQAAQYAWVTLVPAVEHRENRFRYRMVRADLEGRFNITNIVPGEYKMFVFDEIPFNASVNAGFISRYESYGLPITIKSGESLTIDPVVIPSP